MNLIRMTTVAALLASFIGFQTAPAMAVGNTGPSHVEDRWDSHEDQRSRKEKQRAKRRVQQERRENREARRDYWDAARYYRQNDRVYRPRRLTRNDAIYRGSDNRYYCKRDDGTTGLIIGGITGGVLGNIIAPGGWKTLGTIIGAGGGALIGREIDNGDVVCR